jgi:eukaryotic translation initiation factor 2C
VPHYALKGTARPSHFWVLHNDARLTADDLQRFTFDLCHIYPRATKIVSRPAPVYLAHLAAYQAQYYTSAHSIA